MASAKRTNLISLLGLLLLVAIVAVTPEARQMARRLADWVEGVRQERAEIKRRQAEQEAKEALEKARAEETPAEAEATPSEPPPHLVLGEDGQYHPDPGWSWVNHEPGDLRVEWVPGTQHPDNPSVVASAEPDQWSPAAGYEWVEAKGVNDLRVAWKPGKPHPVFGHVLAAAKEGEWTPAPGYNWANDDPNDLTVVAADGGS
jgi:Sec-independent protein translocase protein TatA